MNMLARWLPHIDPASEAYECPECEELVLFSLRSEHDCATPKHDPRCTCDDCLSCEWSAADEEYPSRA